MLFQVFKLCFLFSFFMLIQAQNNENCGVVAKPKGNRIVGGEAIGYMKYPWFAGLFLAMNSNQLVCGGTLISKNHVLTAAHCFKPFFEAVSKGETTLEDIYVVKLGVNNICIQENSQIFATEKVYVHENYYDNLLYYDIALLLLESNTDFMPACLPPVRYESNNRSGLEAIIIGLGKEQSSAWRLPCEVKEAKVQIQTDLTCRRFLDNFGHQGSKLRDAFCAGDGEGHIDTCQGDSGGPLQVEMLNGKYMLLGITSFGFGCARKDTYGIYTDVSHFHHWISYKIDLDQKVKSKQIEAPGTSSQQPTNSPHTSERPKRKRMNLLSQILNW